MNPLKFIFSIIKRLFPRLNRKQRRRFFYENKRTRGAQNLLARYHLLWVKRLTSSGWWYRARRVTAAAA